MQTIRKSKNVKAGTEDSDAVNLKQLNEVKAASDTKVKVVRTFMLKKKSTILQKLKHTL